MAYFVGKKKTTLKFLLSHEFLTPHSLPSCVVASLYCFIILCDNKYTPCIYRHHTKNFLPPTNTHVWTSLGFHKGYSHHESMLSSVLCPPANNVYVRQWIMCVNDAFRSVAIMFCPSWDLRDLPVVGHCDQRLLPPLLLL